MILLYTKTIAHVTHMLGKIKNLMHRCLSNGEHF